MERLCYLKIGFGSVYFMGACGGGSGDPRPVTVAGQPALFDSIGGTRQVIWPATVGHENRARYSVYAYGGLPRSEVLAIAESMAR